MGKQPQELDSIDVQRQLRCAGMLESIRIRRAGYPVRRTFKEFFNRFRVLCPQLTVSGKVDPDYKELCRKVLNEMESRLEKEKMPLQPKSWQIGRSKVFLKEETQTALEKRIADAVKSHVLKIQKVVRGYKQKQRYRKMKVAAIKVQAHLLTCKAAREFKEQQRRNKAAVDIQTALRMAAPRQTFARQRRSAVKIQKDPYKERDAILYGPDINEYLKRPDYKQRWDLFKGNTEGVQSLIRDLLVVDPALRPSAKAVLESNQWLKEPEAVAAKMANKANAKCCVLL